MKQKFTARVLARAAILLALCVVVQQFKSLSQFITGPLVNAILILAGLTVGLWGGICIAILSPLLAFLIAPSPVLQAVPMMLPIIAIGNIIMVVASYMVKNATNIKLGISLAVASVVKGAFMGLTTIYVIIPIFGQNLKAPMVATMSATFSYTQTITAAIGSALVLLVWWKLKNIIKD